MDVFNRDRERSRILVITSFCAVSTLIPRECWYEISEYRYETGVATQGGFESHIDTAFHKRKWLFKQVLKLTSGLKQASIKKFGFRIDWEEWKLCPFYKHGGSLSHGIFYRLRYPLSWSLSSRLISSGAKDSKLNGYLKICWIWQCSRSGPEPLSKTTINSWKLLSHP